jgi:CheY-like chemotaxis protein
MPHPKEPVLVAVTGYGQQNDRAQTRAAGFSHHLVKPVDPSKLLAILEEV